MHVLASGEKHLPGSEGNQIINRRLLSDDGIRTRGLSHWIPIFSGFRLGKQEKPSPQGTIYAPRP